MDARSWFFILLTSLLSLPCSIAERRACAQEAKSTTTSWWNPMTWGAGSNDSSVRKSTYFNGASTSEKSQPAAWSLPKLPWGAAEKGTSSRSTVSTGPSMFKKMGQSTRRAWNSTTDFLNPFNDTPAPPQNQGYKPQSLDTKTSGTGGGMFGWMKPKPAVEKPASVNDWLSQERPRF